MPLFVPGSAVTCGTTATQLYFLTTGGKSRDVTIINQGPSPVFLGSSSVTAATGLQLAAGGQCTLQQVEETVYGIVTGGSTPSATLVGNASVAYVV